MRKIYFILLLLSISCLPIFSYAGGMRYLTQEEFGTYDELLKNNGHPELTTIVAVYDDSFNPPRVGLKCKNKKGKQFQIYISGSKITRIDKIK